jgi:L-ascorbate metabolism protein UlaG (beta-lactamase superfamily)
LNDAVSAHLVPVHHWAARGVLDRNHALWCGFVLTGAMPKTFFVGDTGFDGGKPFRDVARRFGSPDLALLPIGAYEPRWFMAPQHMNPEEAVQGFALLGARQALGYHWGTFRLTNEGVEAPARDLSAALATHRIADERFLALRPGQVWTAPAEA